MQHKQLSSIMLLVLYAMLIGALLLLVIAGARLYGDVIGANTKHVTERSALAFIQNQVASCAGEICLAEGPEGPMLRLAEADGRYETRIYLYDNSLCTQLCKSDAPLDVKNGQRICDMTVFAPELGADGLLTIRADGVLAYAHCAGGAWHAG